MGREIKKTEKFRRLKQMRCFKTVHEMLCYGYPANQVVKFIRGQGEYSHIKDNSLEETLQRYRREILPADVLTTRQPHVIVKAKEQYTDKLKELRTLDVQLEALLYRFDLAHAQEREYGACDPQVDKAQRSILECTRQMHIIKMDLGLSGQRQLGTLTLSPERLEEIKEKYGPGAARAMANPVSRARVLSVLRAVQDRASMIAEGAAIEVTPSKKPE